MPKKTNDTQSFTLKTNESNLLTFTRSHQEAIFSGILSTIAMERLGYNVTERTKFSLNAELTEVTLEELTDGPEPESPVKEAV